VWYVCLRVIVITVYTLIIWSPILLGKKFLERRVNNCLTVFSATNFVTYI